MIPRIQVPPLTGRLVRLEPLDFRHAADLAVAAEEDRSAYDFTLVPRAEGIEKYIAAQFERTEQGLVPFAQVRRCDGRAVGCTAYWNPRYWPGYERVRHFALEIGFTWLGASAQNSGINAEAKMLLLEYAFDTLGVQRVDFKTDARNEKCRRALAAVGTFEGVLRRWSVSWAPGEEGGFRDSAMFSVIAEEWDTVRARLTERVTRHAS